MPPPSSTPQAPPLQPRQGPRPLALHLATEGWMLQMSFAGLMPSSSGSPLSRPLERLRAEVAAQRPNPPADSNVEPLSPPFIEALTGAAKARLDEMVAGITRYQSHPYRRARTPPPALWTCGAAALRGYGGTGPAVLFVPSLINRAHILDLDEDRSLMTFAAAQGVRPFLLDWGAPGPAESAFNAEDYICGVIVPALEFLKAHHGAPAALAGYCMGGTLVAGAAAARSDLISRLALLAAPWDFHADSAASRAFLAGFRPAIETMIDMLGVAPVDFLQAMFAGLDPTLAGRKFRAFARQPMDTDHARRFVALEDWLNDGVDLAGPMAKEALFSWYGDNRPCRGEWRIAGTMVEPRRFTMPSLAVIPTADRIVPPDSARALARAIPGCRIDEIALGHIGMIAGGSAVARVYAPLVGWLRGEASA